MKRWQASYTIEITLLLPVIFMAMFLPVYAAYHLYGEVQHDVSYAWQKDFIPEKNIRLMKYAKQLREEK